MYSLLLLNLIIPFVMILVGDILKRHPATDIKSGNGYNTPTARKSQEHWNYAQSIAPNNFIFLGKVLGVVEIILSIGMFLLQISVNIALTVGICTGIVFLFCGFYKRLCHNKQLINSHFYRGVSELPYKLLFAVIYTHLEFRYEVSHTITSHHVHHFHQTRIPDGTLLDYMVQYRKPLF